MSDSDSSVSSDTEDRAVADAMVEKLLNNDHTLTNIDYCYDDVSEETIHRLVEALQNNVMVDWLSFTGCDLTVGSARAISDMFRINRRVRHLVLNNNSCMGAEGVVAIMEGLCENRKLQSIMLEDNDIGIAALRAITRMLQVNSTLQELSLGCNVLTNDETFADFARSFIANQSLVRLELGHCNLLACSVQHLFECIQGHPTLAHLDLTGNHLNADISESFGNLLRQNHSLRTISVTDNCLGSQTAAAVALALEENTTLQSLVMGNNGIDDEGALALSRSLPRMKGLYDLCLHHNDMTYKGCKALIAGMSRNQSLHSLSLGSRTLALTSAMKQEIQFYKRRNRIGWSTLDSSSLTWALWPHILAKLSSEPSMAYFFICQAPVVVSQAT